MKYVHTNIISKDWKKLAEFYRQVFNCITVPPERKLSGAWLDKGTGVKNARLSGVHLRLPGYGDEGPTLEILQYEKTIDNNLPQANRKGLRHLAFHVDDVKKIYNKILSHGGHNLGRITTKDIKDLGIITFVYMTDPEGNIIEIQNWSQNL